jgi:hypothetical protein
MKFKAKHRVRIEFELTTKSDEILTPAAIEEAIREQWYLRAGNDSMPIGEGGLIPIRYGKMSVTIKTIKE